MLTVGCSQDGINDQNPIKGETVTLGVTLEEGEDVRTSLGDLAGEKYSVVWSENDKISVNGKTSAAVDAQFVGGTTASFTVEDVVAPYDVLYPADALNEDGHLVVATSQAYTAGTFANGVAVMAGTTTSTEVSLKHLFSFVKLTVAKGNESGEAFKSVTITSLDGRAISGHFEVDYATPAVTPAAGEGHDAATVASVPFVDGKAVVYVAVPAGDYSKGFEVKVVGSDDKVMTKTAYTETGIELPAGYLIDMPELTYAGETSTDKVITTATELVTFLSEDLKTEGGSFKGTAKLGNDIDMAGVNLATLAPMPVLLEGATLDGQGYALKNWTTSTGLIYENYGTIKNIVLDKSCALTVGLSDTTTLACGFIVNANLGLVSGCVNNAPIAFGDGTAAVTGNRFVGAIAGCLGQGLLAAGTLGNPDSYTDYVTYKEARIENCVNNGTITFSIASYNSGWFYLGGVAGAYLPHKEESNGGAYNCANHGAISLDMGANSKITVVGGVIGAAGKLYTSAANNPLSYYCKLENCVNTAKVSYCCLSQGQQLYFGGVAGSSHATLTSCRNSGEVEFSTYTDEVKPTLYIAGISGISSGNFTDCHNSGKLYINNIKFGYWAGVAGITSRSFNKNDITVDGCTNSGAIVAEFEGTANQTQNIGGLVAIDQDGVVNYNNCHNSGAITVSVTGAGFAPSAIIGGIVAKKNKLGTLKNCSNSGAITMTAAEGTAAITNHMGGIAGRYDISNVPTMEDCVNSGTLSVSGNLNNNCNVGGLVGSNYHGFKNCKSLGDISLTNTGTGNALIGGFGTRMGNVATTWDGCELDCEITYSGTCIFGLFQADYWGSSNTSSVGATTPCVVKSTTKVNGVAVTAEYIAAHENIVGRDQTVDGKTDATTGKPLTRANSAFQIAEGGIVLQ